MENGWIEWKRHILKEIERLDSIDEKLEKCMQNLIKLESKMNVIWALIWTLVGSGLTAMAQLAADMVH